MRKVKAVINYNDAPGVRPKRIARFSGDISNIFSAADVDDIDTGSGGMNNMLANVDFSKLVSGINFTTAVGSQSGGEKKVGVGAVIGGAIGGALGTLFAPGVGSGAGAAGGALLGKMFDPGGKWGKSVENRAGVRDSDGWGAEVQLPNNEKSVVAPWGKSGDRYIEIGEWGKHIGWWDNQPYVGFKAWLLDSKGNRLKDLDMLAIRYAATNPDGSITTTSNYAPWDKDLGSTWVAAPSGVDNKIVTKTGPASDPPAFTPFSGFVLKSDFMKAATASGNANSTSTGSNTQTGGGAIAPGSNTQTGGSVSNPVVGGDPNSGMLGGRSSNEGTNLNTGTQGNNSGTGGGSGAPGKDDKKEDKTGMWVMIAVAAVIVLAIVFKRS